MKSFGSNLLEFGRVVQVMNEAPFVNLAQGGPKIFLV